MGETVSLDTIFQEMGRIREQVESNRKESSEGRRRTYDAIRDVKTQITDVSIKQDEQGRRLGSVEERLEKHDATVTKVQTLTIKAETAGWIGQRLLSVGGWVLAAAVLVVTNWEKLLSAVKALGK
ncbi:MULTISPECIES: hypothetical protein [Stappiaceae]|jgi:multidrug resistance efflux pump|uniref:hypothetical protein n=1 Tax=Stappiaceae TaxID=2821832 RepID=UPI0012694850|nr:MULTISPECIES: hypothetical protein [Stappiaceae]MBO9457961.1 hypothetical protein [Labrenzia sp. R5_0]QFT00476.1 hypothetical protein FIV06_23815 [Labrenzia sp. THAF191b]QFT06789.1 hypothetical protein FIV05_23810 [Labrenzia sp. THAF191a]QFT18333.1 hypothetical protein FIV03_23825 [Labrenzia sp. THAF187b]UES51562.1 hypothetical protein GFK88_19260 [Roseibium aggregatum]